MQTMTFIPTQELNIVNRGKESLGFGCWCLAVPCVRKGYLAVRSYPSYDDFNELDAIYPENYFTVNVDSWSGNYVWANYNGTQGWVNSDYIKIL